jgi:phasin family protein
MLHDAKATRQRETPQEGETRGATREALLEAGQNAAARWLEGMHALSGEMSELAQARMRLVIEAWSELAACRSPQQIIECHARLAAKGIEHFTGEMTKLSQLMAKMASVQTTQR